jgi:hypothetical protein
MRAPRFNDELNGDLGKYIFKFLLPLDLCMSRVVCKDWSKLIAPQRLTFEQDFCEIKTTEDRQEYVSELEKLIVFPDRLIPVWRNRDRNALVNIKAWPYTFLFYYRKIRTEPSFFGLYKSCETIQHIEDILLPIITFRRELIWELFWCMTRTNYRAGLDWLFKTFTPLFDSNGSFTHPRISLAFDQSSLNGLTHLYNTKNIPPSCWKSYSDSLWRDGGLVASEIGFLIDLALLCNYIPDIACSKISPQQHEKILHLCGCEPAVTYKKRKQ